MNGYRVISQTMGEFWFTDAAVTPEGCGYGFLDIYRNREYHGYLGMGLNPKQAELAAIQHCCMEIASSDQHIYPIVICTDSESAIKALKDYKTKSKLVKECIETLNNLANDGTISVAWVPAHSGIWGNRMADLLAKKGAMISCYGPKPITTLRPDHTRKLCNAWLDHKGELAWRGYRTDSQSKLFLREQNRDLSDKLLTLSKEQIRTVIGIFTGHIALNEYKARFKIRDDPDCDSCNLGLETAFHFLCKCPAWAEIRGDLYKAAVVSQREVLENDLKLICHFTKRTNRLVPRGTNARGATNFILSRTNRVVDLNAATNVLRDTE